MVYPSMCFGLTMAALIPFFVVCGFWFAMDFGNTSSGVDRESDIGVRHSISDEDILLKALTFGAGQGLPWAVGGLALGAVALIYYRKREQKQA
jgi:hypothetical protein